MARKKQKKKSENAPITPDPRTVSLYLVAPDTPSDAFSHQLSDALATGSVSALLFPESHCPRKADLGTAFGAGVAVLVSDADHLEGEVDGLHVEMDGADLGTVRSHLPDHIVGAGGFSKRHDAMEAAEAGADYVSFGRLPSSGDPLSLEQRIELVSWWQDLMEIPCVCEAQTVEEARTLSLAGADFIAVQSLLWDCTDIVATMHELELAIALPE